MPTSPLISRTFRRSLMVAVGGTMLAAFAVSARQLSSPTDTPVADAPTPDAPTADAPTADAPTPNGGHPNEVRADDSRHGLDGDPLGTRPTRRTSGNEEIVITADEWAHLEQFMQQHSPSKWQMYLSLPDRPLKLGLRKQITQRFRTLQRVEKSDPVRWKLEIEAIAIEDRIYATLQELKVGNDVERREQQLRADVDQLVGNRDNWRKERLRRIKAELESMKLRASIVPVDEEIDRLNKMTPEDRRYRVDKRIEEFKRHMDKPPRALLGGRGQPASAATRD